jgi:quercetin dioxygenase-like cupin family protein
MSVADADTDTDADRGPQLFENVASTGARRRIQFFDYHTTPDDEIVDAEQYCEYPESIPTAVDLHAFHEGTCKVQTLFADPVGNGVSLGVYSFPAGFSLPRHWHDCDQIVFVLEGSMSTGNRTLRPGEGYYTRAGARYAFTAGPRGVRFMEFRPVTSFRTVFVEDEPERWVRTDLDGPGRAET